MSALSSVDAALPSTPWWGPRALDVNEHQQLQIGPLSLGVTRAPLEWRVSLERSPDDPRRWLHPPDETMRLTADGDRALRLVPLLAPLPVVARADERVVVGPRQELELFVGSPLFVGLSFADDADVGPSTLLFETSVHGALQTWFGPTPYEGELCYASRTSLRRTLSGAPRVLTRAWSSVTIKNRTAAPFVVERLLLPTPWLSLWKADGRLLTERLVYDHNGESSDASPISGPGGPAPHPGAERVRGPRQARPDRLLVRAFSPFLRAWGR